ncbi:amidophosphoribosyltransferase [Proteinivorax hydrogeniformans]|uniref:Amidophosphoribosyltransferase n=1 Tax=Proteinivorax hydrogeniformans TaxID=1826727 RepID=A0AAU8HTA8_9FIRM
MKDNLDRMPEECGVFGIFGAKDVASSLYYGLISLQHRGQESAGIVVSDGKNIKSHKGIGLVDEVFKDFKSNEYKGHLGIGHVRYSTSGGGSIENCQPLLFKCKLGQAALAHNGNLVNASTLRHQLEQQGSIFHSTNDSEVIAHLLSRASSDDLEGAITSALGQVRGAYSLLLMTEDKLIAIRDPLGIRPLVLGKRGNEYIVASESCALDIVGAKMVREIEPGEMLTISSEGLQWDNILYSKKRAFCSFEYIYFSRPDSDFMGKNVHAVRKNLGKVLAKYHPAEGDIVTGVPDSSLSAAAGLAEGLGIPYESALIRNRYVGRTFIKPSQEGRIAGVNLKLNVINSVIKGKRVIMVDDSIVRGTTSRKIVEMLKQGGAKEVHVRISAPPVTHPCHLGIDTSSQGELLAANNSLKEMTKAIKADSLAFLTPKQLLEGIGVDDGLCDACFTGNYPVKMGCCK